MSQPAISSTGNQAGPRWCSTRATAEYNGIARTVAERGNRLTDRDRRLPHWRESIDTKRARRPPGLHEMRTLIDAAIEELVRETNAIRDTASASNT